MKYIAIFFFLILMSVAAWAQDMDAPKRNITLKLTNKKGRPLKNIVVQSSNTDKAGITDRKGLFIFREMTDSDTISIMLSKYGESIIPVAGMDSIVVMLRSARLYSYINIEGQNVYIEKPKNDTKPSDILDVPALLKQGTYNSLADLLRGRVAGLNVSPSGEAINANMRGINSIAAGSRGNQPLVVIDGLAVGTLSEANSQVDIYHIKTIEVQKTGSEWGTRGAGGVILISTK